MGTKVPGSLPFKVFLAFNSKVNQVPEKYSFLTVPSTKAKRLKPKTISGHRRGGESHVDRVSLPAAPSNLDDLRRGRHPRPQGQDRQVLQGPVGRAQQAQPGQHPHREVAVV